MLSVHDLELRVGARLLMEGVDFRVADGDKIGLVGRNGAGKTTLTKVLAGESLPTGGRVDRSEEIGYLPQDPRSGNPEDLARTRILDARGLGSIVLGMQQSTHRHGQRRPGGQCSRDEEVRPPGGAVPHARRLRGRSRSRLHRQQPQPARPHPRPAAEDTLRRPAPPYRTRAHPVLGRQDDDPRRADEPPRCRLRRLAA